MPHREDQGARAKPSLCERRLQLRGSVIGDESRTEIAVFLERYPQAEIGVGISWLERDRALQGLDRFRNAADLEAGQAEIVADDRIRRREKGRLTQRADRIAGSPCLEQLSGERQERLGRVVWRFVRGRRHDSTAS